jgi:hypothetical protein
MFSTTKDSSYSPLPEPKDAVVVDAAADIVARKILGGFIPVSVPLAATWRSALMSLLPIP